MNEKIQDKYITQADADIRSQSYSYVPDDSNNPLTIISIVIGVLYLLHKYIFKREVIISNWTKKEWVILIGIVLIFT
jgi:hypothetical protein